MKSIPELELQEKIKDFLAKKMLLFKRKSRLLAAFPHYYRIMRAAIGTEAKPKIIYIQESLAVILLFCSDFRYSS